MSESACLVLECQQVFKTYTDMETEVEVLKGIDLNLSEAEQLAIVGASGSGKSTLLHILGGLDTFSRGIVRLAGQDVASLSASACGRLRNQMLGFVYQFHHLLPEFTALENVAMPLLIAKVPIREATERAAEILQKVGLGPRLQHKPAKLSGGERQRAAIARAMVTRPACILADEPTGNLDNKTAEQVYEMMLELNSLLKVAFIIVTHDRQLTLKMDRTFLLENGVLIEQ